MVSNSATNFVPVTSKKSPWAKMKRLGVSEPVWTVGKYRTGMRVHRLRIKSAVPENYADPMVNVTPLSPLSQVNPTPETNIPTAPLPRATPTAPAQQGVLPPLSRILPRPEDIPGFQRLQALRAEQAYLDSAPRFSMAPSWFVDEAGNFEQAA